MDPQPLPGATLATVVQALESVAMDAQNQHSYLSRSELDTRNNYIHWANRSEGTLRGVFSRWDARALVRGTDYWNLRALQDLTRAGATFGAAYDERIASLRELATSFDGLRAFIERGGTPAVLDTHVLLHFVRPDQIMWEEVLGGGAHRLVLPLRVVEELDKKKWDGSERMRGRARAVLAMLRSILEGGAGPKEVRAGVDLEIYVPDEPRMREPDADQEILDLARVISANRAGSRLLTEDAAFELRARAVGVDVVRMPERYLRDKAEPGQG